MKKITILALAAMAAGGVVANDGARSPHISAFDRAPLLTHVTPKGWRTGDSIVMSHERTGELIDIYMNGRKIIAAKDMVRQ